MQNICMGQEEVKRPVIPEIKTQGKKTFMYNGAKLWNSLPVSMKSIEDKENFRKKCKK